MTQKDLLHRFVFNEEHIRGEIVQLDYSVKALLNKGDYPAPIRDLLAKMASAASLLCATLKFEGEISLQIQGKGPVSYAILTATNTLTYRGVARWDETLEQLPQTFEELCADAVLVITLSPNEGERYQGVVALDKPSLAQCIESYFEQSEQLLTRVYLYSETEQDVKSGGMLLQVLPQSSEATEHQEAEAFHHFATLADTLTADEVFSLPVKTLLHRLYHEHDIELFDAEEIRYACTCSRERSLAALLHVEKSELLSIVEEQGEIAMNCQYCHATYSFDAIDVEALHAGNVATQNSASPQH
ncbi:Hsp33 family molecular chaperone HslO [Alteromonas sp. 5E99-2]|uniref:Hsp33 family molecular chaperone HslO n=1 Tax=Alteromonas sp. 5E99-2 TaxID=2817683 RepID=UPI001A9904A6|nr:Hsp33 family molecular chaperone HslO [Alteromonas sp. 5E99-2]MBO1256824.1 Hsp33 family molecular chaperone HslO [Alteromonas sp. 5E99-2]